MRELLAAAVLGISQQYLSDIVTCKERPARHQRALAKLCGCSPVDLFGPFTNPELQDMRKDLA
ncbi:MAG: hypothetical protein IMZ62_12880 [Chloroflexi bacterium]|nr:hypothetical protein [Chloroflexota bacterium]MBE3119098.1 hypothetical protein [Candidatus Atribacteria bacterium]